jgi:predicted O-methyltransferase YrrM
MNYEYCGMYNWTTDCPINTKMIFINILNSLEQYDKPKILEVGTFAGTSISTMLDILPNAIGVAIDNWSIDKKEFENCIKIAQKPITIVDIKNAFINNTNNRVVLIEDDSTNALVNLINNKEYFHFIYVDASHGTLDTLLDITLSWMLLFPGGILGIDDYEYLPPNSNNGVPKDAINKFLDKFKGKYIIINKNYRIFLLKK